MISLLVTIALFGPAEPPPAQWRFLPQHVKEAIAGAAHDLGISDQDNQEVPSWESFDGAVYVWRMRLNGTPLPYPHDPVWGSKLPQKP